MRSLSKYETSPFTGYQKGKRGVRGVWGFVCVGGGAQKHQRVFFRETERKKKEQGRYHLTWSQGEGGVGATWSKAPEPPYEEACNGMFCLSDWEISQLQSKHTLINTHRKKKTFVFSNTCLQFSL